MMKFVICFIPGGPSERKTLPGFQALHGLKGAAICEAEIVRGIAKGLHLTAPKIAERQRG